MPGSSDAAVVALRKWLDTFGAALPTLPKSAADIPPLMPREQVMDRLKQHTEVRDVVCRSVSIKYSIGMLLPRFRLTTPSHMVKLLHITVISALLTQPVCCCCCFCCL